MRSTSALCCVSDVRVCKCVSNALVTRKTSVRQLGLRIQLLSLNYLDCS